MCRGNSAFLHHCGDNYTFRADLGICYSVRKINKCDELIVPPFLNVMLNIFVFILRMHLVIRSYVILSLKIRALKIVTIHTVSVYVSVGNKLLLIAPTTKHTMQSPKLAKCLMLVKCVIIFKAFQLFVLMVKYFN